MGQPHIVFTTTEKPMNKWKILIFFKRRGVDFELVINVGGNLNKAFKYNDFRFIKNPQKFCLLNNINRVLCQSIPTSKL